MAEAELEEKLKTALDETRLLILGAQVMFGFQLQGVFQDSFKDLPADSQAVHCVGLALLFLAICFLITPSLHHQIVFAGTSRIGALTSATAFAGWSLLPFTLGVGASMFVIFDHLFGRRVGFYVGALFAGGGFALLYGLGWVLKRGHRKNMSYVDEETPLRVKIEQLLTEARVIIPGAQALLGFQLIATLTKQFQELPIFVQYVHAFGLCMVAFAVMLLMTPAAVHRIAFQGENDQGFFRLGSALVIAAACPLAIGISADFAVVFYVVTRSSGVAAGAGLLGLSVLLAFWFALPLWRRSALTSNGGGA